MTSRRRASWPWLETIPAHWQEAKIVYFARLLTGGTPDRDNSAYWTDGEIPWVASGEVNQRLIKYPTALITRIASENSNAKVLPVGSVVVALAGQGRTKGMAAILGIPAAVNQSLAAFVCDEHRLHHRFLCYYLAANYQNLRGLVGDDLRDGLSLGHLAAIRCPLPPYQEQVVIADFLDRKTCALDAVVVTRERSLELLAEYRRAVLTRTVTSGLAPSTAMKPSGVPWFAQVPAHWTITKLKYVSPQVTVGIVVTPAKYYVDEGVPVLRSFNIKPGRITDSALAFISPESNELHAKSKLSEGDLVAVRTGQPGTTAVVDRQFHEANCVDLIVIRRSKRLTSQFACHFMNSGPAHQQYGEGSEGALQQHFNVETAKNLVLPVPSLDEQNAIVGSLERELDRIDTVVSRIEKQLSALRQYRQALLAAAVTGQLDVTQGAA